MIEKKSARKAEEQAALGKMTKMERSLNYNRMRDQYEQFKKEVGHHPDASRYFA